MIVKWKVVKGMVVGLVYNMRGEREAKVHIIISFVYKKLFSGSSYCRQLVGGWLVAGK